MGEIKMKLLQHAVFALAAVLCLSAVNVSAETLPYFSLKGSHSQIKTDNFDYDNALGAKWAVGASVLQESVGSLRAELEYSGVSASYFEFSGRDNGDPHSNEDRASHLDSKTLFVNMYFDVNIGTIFTPYIGAGIGVSNASADYNFQSGRYSIPESRVSDWKLGWNVGAGVGVRLTQQLTLDLGYRYTDLGHFSGMAGLYKEDYAASSTWRTQEEKLDFDLTSHEVVLGLRYTF